MPISCRAHVLGPAGPGHAGAGRPRISQRKKPRAPSDVRFLGTCGKPSQNVEGEETQGTLTKDKRFFGMRAHCAAGSS